MKNQKGITLIALSVTIIIMLILAGVTINFMVGEAGIFSNTKKAVSETTIAQAQEESEMMIAKLVIDYHKEFIMDQTAAEYVGEKLGDGSLTSSGDFFVTVNDEMVRVYEGENADEANKVALGKLDTSGAIEWTDFVKLPSDLNIGDYVTYSPSGTYNWQAKYASSDLADDGTADVLLATGSSVAEGAQDMSITSWRVFSIDEITGNVELVPSAQTTKTVRLQGAQGYNNAVKLLNDACSSLYGNSEKGISARSINIEDIEGAMTDEALATAHSYVNTENNNLQYGKQTASAYTVNKQYPTIYAKENLSVVNGIKKENGLGMSEQTALIGRTDEGAELGKITTATSIQPYQTCWTKDNAFMQTAFKENGYNLLIPGGTVTYYWVASRCVDANSSSCPFRVSRVYDGRLGAHSLYGSGGGRVDGTLALFPVVSLNVNLIDGNDTDGWKIE